MSGDCGEVSQIHESKCWQLQIQNLENSHLGVVVIVRIVHPTPPTYILWHYTIITYYLCKFTIVWLVVIKWQWEWFSIKFYKNYHVNKTLIIKFIFFTNFDKNFISLP